MRTPVKVEKLGVVLEPTPLYFESTAVLNPACVQDGEYVHLFYRAIDSNLKSSIGYAKLKGPTTIVERSQKPIISREHDYESFGIEDPRIVKIGETFYMTYVAHDGKNAVSAYATSHDLKKFQKKGVFSPQITYKEAAEIFREQRLKDSYLFFADFYQEEAGNDVLIWHKDAILFPRKINKQFAMLHRILPDIQIVFFKDFKSLTRDFWQNYIKNLSKHVVLENKHWFETRNIGGGCPPIETEDGWLMIMHGVEENNEGRFYHASAALLDKNDPKKVIGKLHEPLFSPTREWEVAGMVSNVVFPTGTAIFGDQLFIYYGAADKRIAVASVNIKELVAELKNRDGIHAL